MKKKGFTLIELLVVIAIIAMLLAILMPALNKVKKIAQRVVCGTNLKGLGTAQAVYANDYEDQYVRQGGSSQLSELTWTNFTGQFLQPGKVWAGAQNVTIGSSLYLLVREADVSPKSFVCGSGGQTAYDGKNTAGLDLVELWDFGSQVNPDCGGGPTAHVSYSYHLPYCNRAANGSSSASFAVMADKNPWMDPKLSEMDNNQSNASNWMGNVERMGRYFMDALNPPEKEKWQKQKANAYPHDRDGQNVMYGDGHNAYEKTTDVGVRHDGIYVQQVGPGTTEGMIRCGMAVPNMYQIPEATCNNLIGDAQTAPGMFGPISASDSLLVNDDY